MLTAMLTMAVLFFGLATIGCVTPRHIDEIKAQIRNLEAESRQTQEMVTRMDSTIESGASADNRLRNDITTSSGEIQQQISALLENYSELLQKLDEISRQRNVQHVLRDSPGAGSTGRRGGPQQGNEVESSFDCGTAYDEAFILVRRGEYEKAIDGFTRFLAECPKHESAENAHYWIGESYYSMEKYTEASQQFEKLLRDFQTSPNAGRAIYKLARSKQELGKKDDARKLYQRLIDDYPETLEAQQAADRLKDL